MSEPRSAEELEVLIRRCVSGYPGEREMMITIQPLPGQTPNWDCSVKYNSQEPGAPLDSLEREVAALKLRFHLVE
jgi:hypothetical protein